MNFYQELSTPWRGVDNSERSFFMKRILIVEQFMRCLADELQNGIERRETKSDEYNSGYNDALEFVMKQLRRY